MVLFLDFKSKQVLTSYEFSDNLTNILLASQRYGMHIHTQHLSHFLLIRICVEVSH